MEKLFVDRRNPLHDDISNRLLTMMDEDHAKAIEQRDHLYKVLSLVYNELQQTEQSARLSTDIMNLIQSTLDNKSPSLYSH